MDLFEKFVPPKKKPIVLTNVGKRAVGVLHTDWKRTEKKKKKP
jgi:hypothetical protein